jgi:hypothetical protein
MMKRLRELPPSGDERLDFAARVVGESPPLPISPERMARVEAAVRGRAARPPTGGTTGGVPGVAKLFVGAVGLGAAIVVAATLLASRYANQAQRPVPPTPPVPVVAPVPPVVPVAPVAPVVPVAPSPPVEKHDAKPPAHPRHRPESPVSDGSEADRAAERSAAQLVTRAMRLLRVEHRPAEAEPLLSSYLERFPQGPVAEEALALLVEASARDQAQARALAARYLRTYPDGRFAEPMRALVNSPPRQ